MEKGYCITSERSFTQQDYMTHDCFTWSIFVLHILDSVLLLSCRTYWNCESDVTFTFILATSSPVNSGYDERHRSDAGHSAPSGHATNNTLLQHRTGSIRPLKMTCTFYKIAAKV